MKASDLQNKTKDELSKTLLDLKKEQMEARFQLASGQLENTAKYRQLRRDIARVQTVMNTPEDAKTETKKAPAKKPAAKKATKKDKAA